MAEIIWTEPALSKLDEIADYITLDKPQAARELVQRVFQHVEQLSLHPQSGLRPAELKGSRYRQIIEPPCRIFYRVDGDAVIILYIMRGEGHLRRSRLSTKR
jgi:toxin ParE1/3/4